MESYEEYIELCDENEEPEEIPYYRILNLEGAWLNPKDGAFTYRITDKKQVKRRGKVKEYTLDKNKIYTATMPYSLETIRAFNKYPDEIFKIGDEEATNLFVNFKFSKDMIDDNDSDGHKEKVKKVKLRKLIYTSKVTIDDVEYCYFKRGASKARTANVIFVKEACYDTLFKPCLLGLDINDKDEYDITSLSAYVALVMSGIIGTVEIKPDEIMIIDDIISPEFEAVQSVTEYNQDGKIEQNIKENSKVKNNTTDGQVLLNESIFKENKLLETATCALLRNDFFKGNAVRTRLQEYWKINEIKRVWDMCRGWIEGEQLEKIKLVITPSACKYLKFNDQFGKSDKECFLNWLEKIPSTFGVVKTDHIGRYGYSNRLSYQMVNSMNLDRDTLKDKIMKNELDYYKLLKDNTPVNSAELKKLSKKEKPKERKLRNEMTYFLNHINVNSEKDIGSQYMFTELLKVNSDIRFIKEFKNWKKEQLKMYVNNMRRGKIRIKNSLYAIMVSCPYEMLVATTKENNKVETSIMNGWELYCPHFDDGSELLAIRNPQINAGNIAHFTNKWHKEFTWFGYYGGEGGLKRMYDSVCFINSWDVDCMNRLQGCDWDIDSIFLSDDVTLCAYAKDSQSWATPTNGIKGVANPKKYTPENLAKLDSHLGGSTRQIGKIVNKSAIFNGYMYDGINNGKCKDYIDSCYKASSTLSSLSQIAIDMAKKSFGRLSLEGQERILNKTSFEDNNGKKKQILQYDYDTVPEDATIYEVIKDYWDCENNENRIPEFKLANDEDWTKILELKNQWENIKDGSQLLSLMALLGEAVKVHKRKMIVPYFFQFIADDNKYRIPQKMDCGMDYLEEILDDLDTKAMGTDSKEIADFIVRQKEFDGHAYNPEKVDDARIIVDKCQSVLNQNRDKTGDSEQDKEDKKRLRRWVRKDAVQKLIDLDLNPKTVHRIILRAFGLDPNYKGHYIPKLKDNGEEITYTDNETGEIKKSYVKELKGMTILALTLLHRAYHDVFMQCFIKKESNLKKVKFWK
jgi:hypothetical protein